MSKLLEGRVAILTDGSPIALTLPFILIEDLHSPDDYYQKSFRVSFVRLVRLIGVFAAVLLPGFYLAIELYHYKIIPLNLLVTLSNATANLPFGPLLEMLFVIILFEILYEANARMPRYLGMALSIVGALILGDTAVKAGLVSSPAVMIVALSGITIYTVPNEAGQLSLLRLGFTLAGGMMSFYGIVILLVFLIFYLANFNSYGSPYLAPMAPFIYGDQKDAIVKSPITKMKNRPISILNKNKVRLKKLIKAIKQNQIVALAFLLPALTKFLILPSQIINFSGKYAYLVVLILFCLEALLAYFIFKMIEKAGKTSFFTLLKARCGVLITKVITIIFGLYFIIKALMLILDTNNLFNYSFYNNFSPYFFIFGLFVLLFYTVNLKLKTFARSFEVFVLPFAISITIVVVLSLMGANILNSLPIIEQGWLNMITSGFKSIFLVWRLYNIVFVYRKG